jgi:hypothetical protein
MKACYMGLTDWRPEATISVGTNRYRTDVLNIHTNRVREFVNSLSPTYVNKHNTLKDSVYKVSWILNGNEFVSSSMCLIGDGIGIRKMLKPRAFDLHSALGGTFVLYDNKLWEEWRYDSWYPCNWYNVEARDIMDRIKSGPK